MKRVSYKEYVKMKGRQPVITHFQPNSFVVFENDKERKAWVQNLSKNLGFDVEGSHFTWGDPTFSGDADWTDRVGDDCAE
jgi:hypothetical protein